MSAAHGSIADRINLVAALRARLDALYAECARCSEESLHGRGFEAAEREWDAVSLKAERTRKTLVRAQEGVPYWKVRQRPTEDFWAEGGKLRTRGLSGRIYTVGGVLPLKDGPFCWADVPDFG